MHFVNGSVERPGRQAQSSRVGFDAREPIACPACGKRAV